MEDPLRGRSSHSKGKVMNSGLNHQQRSRTERGSVATEYALLVVVIAIGIIGGMAMLASPIDGLFGAVCNPPSPFNC